jgi:hypothetical protein
MRCVSDSTDTVPKRTASFIQSLSCNSLDDTGAGSLLNVGYALRFCRTAARLSARIARLESQEDNACSSG